MLVVAVIDLLVLRILLFFCLFLKYRKRRQKPLYNFDGR